MASSSTRSSLIQSHRRVCYYNRTRLNQIDRTTNKWYGYASDWSSDYYYLDKSYDTWYEGLEYSTPNILPFHSRPVGPPHEGLRSIKRANKRFAKLMSCISYRLMIRNDTRSLKATEEIRVHIKNLNLMVKNHSFDGTDQIRILGVLTRFVNE